MKIIKLSKKKSAKHIKLAADYLRTLFNPKKEEVRVLFLDSKDNIIQHTLLAQGTKDRVESDLKKVFAVALAWNMGRVVLAHNHPNSSSNPSINDILIAQEAHDLAVQFGVDLYQIIVGTPCDINPGFFDLTNIVAEPYFFEKFFVGVSMLEEELFEYLINDIFDEKKTKSKKRKVKLK